MSGTDYDTYWKHRATSHNRYRYDVFLSWIIPGSTVLDVGCGDGSLGSRCITELGCAVTGLDVSSVALGLAAKRGLMTVRGTADGPLPFGDDEFDYVIASEVIEHVVRSEEALKELCRIARKAIIVSIPNSAYWRHRWALLRGRVPRQWIRFPWEHVRFWSIGEFRAMVAGLDMEISEFAAAAGHPRLQTLRPSLFAQQACFLIPKRAGSSTP